MTMTMTGLKIVVNDPLFRKVLTDTFHVFKIYFANNMKSKNSFLPGVPKMDILNAGSIPYRTVAL